MIKPTIGRVLHYIVPGNINDGLNGNGLYAAVVTDVHSDSMVNLSVFDSLGDTRPRTSVELVQDGQTVPSDRPYCQWMPYQVGQAAKTEAMAEELADTQA